MNWELLFSATNAAALVAWVALAALPRTKLLLSAVLYLGVGLLCLTYAILLPLLVTGSVDPGLPTGTAPQTANFTTIEGIRAIFASDGGVVVGWTHYLAFDLFAGLWIARDADRKGVSRWLQLPILFATLMAGPIGLLTWLVVRGRGEPAR
jgi:hypothetical protein